MLPGYEARPLTPEEEAALLAANGGGGMSPAVAPPAGQVAVAPGATQTTAPVAPPPEYVAPPPTAMDAGAALGMGGYEGDPAIVYDQQQAAAPAPTLGAAQTYQPAPPVGPAYDFDAPGPGMRVGAAAVPEPAKVGADAVGQPLPTTLNPVPYVAGQSRDFTPPEQYSGGLSRLSPPTNTPSATRYPVSEYQNESRIRQVQEAKALADKQRGIPNYQIVPPPASGNPNTASGSAYYGAGGRGSYESLMSSGDPVWPEATISTDRDTRLGPAPPPDEDWRTRGWNAMTSVLTPPSTPKAATGDTNLLDDWGEMLQNAANYLPRPDPSILAEMDRYSEQRRAKETPSQGVRTPLESAITGGAKAAFEAADTFRIPKISADPALQGLADAFGQYVPRPAESLQTRGEIAESQQKNLRGPSPNAQEATVPGPGYTATTPAGWGGDNPFFPDPYPNQRGSVEATGPIVGGINDLSDLIWGPGQSVMDTGAGKAVSTALGDIAANSADNRTFGFDTTGAAEVAKDFGDWNDRTVKESSGNAGQISPATATDAQNRAKPTVPGGVPNWRVSPSTAPFVNQSTAELDRAALTNDSGFKDAVEPRNGVLYIKGTDTPIGLPDTKNNLDKDGNPTQWEMFGTDYTMEEFDTEAATRGVSRTEAAPGGAGTTQQTATGGQSPTPAQGSTTQPQTTQTRTNTEPVSSSRQTNSSSQSSNSSRSTESPSRQRGSSIDDMFGDDDDFGLNERDFTEKDYDGDGRISAKDRSVGRKRYQSELSKRRKKKGKTTSFGNVPQREDSPIRTKVLSAIDTSVNKKKRR